jgi:hypothetical protein
MEGRKDRYEGRKGGRILRMEGRNRERQEGERREVRKTVR